MNRKSEYSEQGEIETSANNRVDNKRVQFAFGEEENSINTGQKQSIHVFAQFGLCFCSRERGGALLCMQFPSGFSGNAIFA